MAKPVLDVMDLCAMTKRIDGRGLAEAVGANPSAVLGIDVQADGAGVLLDDVENLPAGERSASRWRLQKNQPNSP